MRALLALALLLAGAPGCRERGAAPSGVSSAEPEAAGPGAGASAPVGLGALLRRADLRLEAARGVLAPGEPLLEAHRAELEPVFGWPLSAPLAAQAAVVSSGARGLFLGAASPGPGPLVLVLGERGELVWSRRHPLGGVKPGASLPTLASAPDGHLVLAWCNASTASVAVREWAEEGNPFADTEALHYDECRSLAALHWPGQGLLLAVGTAGGVRLQRLATSGELAFGREGLLVPARLHPDVPPALALDAEGRALLLTVSRDGGDGAPLFLFARGLDPAGAPTFPGPLALERLAADPGPSARLELSHAEGGALRVRLGGARGNGRDLVVDLTADGRVDPR